MNSRQAAGFRSEGEQHRGREGVGVPVPVGVRVGVSVGVGVGVVVRTTIGPRGGPDDRNDDAHAGRTASFM